MNNSIESTTIENNEDNENMCVTESIKDTNYESSSDSEDDLEEEIKLKQKADDFEKRLSENPFDYNSHISLIKIKHEILDLVGWRSAYERFSSLFPLTPNLWLEWITVEMGLATSEKENEYVTSLFERSVSDYLSVRLWVEYIQFIMKLTSNNVEAIRTLFKRAVSEAGFHISESGMLWTAYIDFELEQLSLISNKDSNEWQQQVQVLSSACEQRFNIPLLDMEHAYVDFRVCAERLSTDLINMDIIKENYRIASRRLEQLKKMDKDIVASKDENTKLKLYFEYIQLESENVQSCCAAYERAIADIQLNAELWRRYCSFVVSKRSAEQALKVCERSIRNCPWSSELWVFKLRVMELFGKNHDEVTTCFESALTSVNDASSHLDLWLAYIEHCRRNLNNNANDQNGYEHLRKVFEKACAHLAETWGLQGDPSCVLLRYWARLEAATFGDIDAARRLWVDILSRDHEKTAAAWLELLTLERLYGNAKRLRKTYIRALERTQDWPQSIAESWLNYERDVGTLDTLMSCVEICRENAIKRAAEKHDDYEMDTTEDKDRKRKLEKSRRKDRDRPRAKKAKISENDNDSTKRNSSVLNEMESKDVHTFVTPERESKTIFVSNIDYLVDETSIANWFGDSVIDVRLIRNFSGKSKGYCYVEFSSVNKATEALKRDGEKFNGRPMFISRCESEKVNREHAFKYSVAREPDKLFVKGLPRETTTDDLTKMFSKFGKLKDVRTVCFKSGQSKGLAYINFEEASDAAKAVLATNGTVVGDRTISVAISEPPQRKEVPASFISNMPRVAPVSALRKSKLQLSLVPTILQKKQVAIAADGSEQSKVKSNADFRAMLLGKK